MEGRDDEGQLVDSYELKEDGTAFYIDEYPYDLYQKGTLFFIWGDDAISGRKVTPVEVDLSKISPTRESIQAFAETNEDIINFFKKIAADSGSNN